jgi:hypothetical protein
MNYLAPEETAAAAEIIAPYSSLAAGLFRESRTNSREYEGSKGAAGKKLPRAAIEGARTYKATRALW